VVSSAPRSRTTSRLPTTSARVESLHRELGEVQRDLRLVEEEPVREARVVPERRELHQRGARVGGLPGRIEEGEVDDEAPESVLDQPRQLVRAGERLVPSDGEDPAEAAERDVVALRVEDAERVAEREEALGEEARQVRLPRHRAARDEDVHPGGREPGGRAVLVRPENGLEPARLRGLVGKDGRPEKESGERRAAGLREDDVGRSPEGRDGVGHRDAELARAEQGMVVLRVPERHRRVSRDAEVAERVEEPGPLRDARGDEHHLLPVPHDLHLEPEAPDLLERGRSVAGVPREDRLPPAERDAAPRERLLQLTGNGRGQQARAPRPPRDRAVLPDDPVEELLGAWTELQELPRDAPGDEDQLHPLLPKDAERFEDRLVEAPGRRQRAVVVERERAEVLRHLPSREGDRAGTKDDGLSRETLSSAIDPGSGARRDPSHFSGNLLASQERADS